MCPRAARRGVRGPRTRWFLSEGSQHGTSFALSLSLSLSLAILAMSAPVHASDVVIEHQANAFDTSGNDFDLSINLGTNVEDGDGLIVLVGINAADAQRRINSVKLKDAIGGTGRSDLAFTRVGFIDDDDTGDDMLIEIYKLNNRTFITTSDFEDDYDRVDVDFPESGNINYTFAHIVIMSNQDGDGMVRNFQSDEEEGQTSHNVDTFVLEPDALVLTATIWTNGALTTDFSTGETESWDQPVNNNQDGFFVHHDFPGIPVPEGEAYKDMIATSSAAADTVSASVVIRSAGDITCTHGTPGTAADTGQYWLEGMPRNDNVITSAAEIWKTNPSQTSKDHDDLEYGSNITEGQFIYIPRWMAKGKNTYDTFGIGEDLGIMDFSPLVADREAKWDSYIAGLKEILEDSDDSGDRFGQLFGGQGQPEFITEFEGVVQWDHEDYFMNFDGADGPDGAEGRGHMKYDPHNTEDNTDDDEWEYNAACRYFWERLHQWLTEDFAPDVEAFVFYHHPWQPLADQANEPSDNWAGQPEDDQLKWLFSLQGSFDGHCYPPHALGYPADQDEEDAIHTWVTKVLENFETMQGLTGHAPGLFCYVTIWPSRPNGATLHSPESLTQLIDAVADMRDGGWTDFDISMNGVPGLGGGGATNYNIAGYDDDNQTGVFDQVRIVLGGATGPAGTKRFEFDPRFEQFKIEDTSGTPDNDGIYDWDFDNGYPGLESDGGLFYCDLLAVGDTFNSSATGGHVIRRAYTWNDFLVFWGEDEDVDDGSFLKILNDRIGN